MNRRDFIGAAIGTLVAALLLSFEEFAAWCKRWFGRQPDRLFIGVDPAGGPSQTAYLVSWRDQYGEPRFERWELRSAQETVTGRITKVDHLRGTITVSA